MIKWQWHNKKHSKGGKSLGGIKYMHKEFDFMEPLWQINLESMNLLENVS